MSDDLLVVSETELMVVSGNTLEVIDSTQVALILEVAEQGPAGPAGPTGLTGLTGPTGSTGPQGIAGSGDLSFQYAQGPASATWLITHNLGKYPSVTVVDSAGEQVEGKVEYINANSLRLVFSAAFTGNAFLN